MNKKLIYVFVFIAIFSLGITGLFYFSNLKKQKDNWVILESEIRKKCDDFEGEAGVIIKDLKKGWQININQDKLFPSASLVKIPIMFACFYAVNEGKISLGETLKLNASDRVLGSGDLKAAGVGVEFTVEKLIELMISESDNTAANMLIGRIGFDSLNGYFKKMGLKETNICRKMMDFESRSEGKENFTTPSDLTNLLDGIYKGRLINKTYSQIGLEFLKEQRINDRIPAKLPADIMVAHKTGLENGVCHDAGIVFSSKGDFLICVLTSHRNKTAKPAKNFIAQIAFLAYHNYENKI